MTGLLGGAVRLVMMQFAFSALRHIPSCLKQKPAKMPEESATAKGEQCLSATEDVGIADFVADLKDAAYCLVDSYYQIRNRGGQQYAVIRFLFAQEQQADISEEFRNMRPGVEQALLQMCESAMWRVRAFLNPFFKEGQLIDDLYAISVNLENRKPLFNENGEPLLQWQKNEKGEKIGDCPLPLKPKRFLRIINGDIRVA